MAGLVPVIRLRRTGLATLPIEQFELIALPDTVPAMRTRKDRLITASPVSGSSVPVASAVGMIVVEITSV